MQDVIRSFRDSAPKEIIAKLYQCVTGFCGTRQGDDLTAVIIKRL